MLIVRLKNDGRASISLNNLQKRIKTEIDNKVERDIYKFENLEECEICGSSDSEVVGEKDRYGLQYPVQLCKNCGLIFTNPRMTQESYNDFYNEDYRKLYGGKTTADPNFYDLQLNQGRLIHKYLKKRNLIKKESQFILEIGCGAGGILGYFKSLGHKVKGIDLGREYIEYGRKNHGLEIETMTIAQLELDETPDIIIYSHVMEHILDLSRELTLLKKICGRKTIIYIEVPGVKNIHKNYKRDIAIYLQNAHTYHFTLTSLTNLFRQHGYVNIGGTEYVRAAFKLGNDKKELIREYKSIRRYLLFLEKTRFLGFLSINNLKMKIKNNLKKILK